MSVCVLKSVAILCLTCLCRLCQFPCHLANFFGICAHLCAILKLKLLDYTGRQGIGTLFQWKFESEESNSLCNYKHDLPWKVWQSSSDPHHYFMLQLHILNYRIKWKSEIRRKREQQQLKRSHFLTCVWRHNHRDVTGRPASRALA